jgi:type I restriction enzyme M protein
LKVVTKVSDYPSLSDDVITPEIKDDAIKDKRLLHLPKSAVCQRRRKLQTPIANLNTDLAAIFAAIESSANGYPSEQDIKGLVC